MIKLIWHERIEAGGFSCYQPLGVILFNVSCVLQRLTAAGQTQWQIIFAVLVT